MGYDALFVAIGIVFGGGNGYIDLVALDWLFGRRGAGENTRFGYSVSATGRGQEGSCSGPMVGRQQRF